MKTLTPPKKGWGMVPYDWVQRLLAEARPGGRIQGLWHFKMAYYLAALSSKGECKHSRERLFERISPERRPPSRSTLHRGLQALRSTGLLEIKVPPGGPRSKMLVWRIFEHPSNSARRRIWRLHTHKTWFKEASPNTIRVLWALTLYRNDDEKSGHVSSYSSVATLAEVSGLSKRSVQTHLRRLEEAGIIETHGPRAGRKTPTYFLAFPEPRLLYYDGESWVESGVGAIARRVFEETGRKHYCARQGSQEVHEAERFSEVREAMIRLRYSRR